MISIPLFESSVAPAALRRPAAKVELGSASADDWSKVLVSVTSLSCVAPDVDVVELVFVSGPTAPSVSVGDSGKISLGFDDDDTHTVFTGEVESVRYSIEGTTRVCITNGGAALSALRVSQSYEQQNAGDIVRDLTGRAGVTTSQIEDGVDLSFCVLDDRQSAYRHIAALARRCSFIARFTPDGELIFGPYTNPEVTGQFAYGADVLSLELTDARPLLGTINVSGEGAAGGHGADAWNWLVKDNSGVSASAGSSTPELALADSVLRANAAVSGAANSLLGFAETYKLAGTVVVPGSPLVAPGSAIDITEAPQAPLNCRGLVWSARHSFSKSAGFTTQIKFRKIGDAGGGGSLLDSLIAGIGGLL